MFDGRIEILADAVGKPAAIRQEGAGKSSVERRRIDLTVFITRIKTLLVILSEFITEVKAAIPVLRDAVAAAPIPVIITSIADPHATIIGGATLHILHAAAIV